jgi:ACT domain-containing protein
MKTIKGQLQEIHTLGNSVLEITQNYSMGFISVTEMMMQISSVKIEMDNVREDIRDEYMINDIAINILLNF